MSVAEKKALAVEKLKALENEVAIDEILEHLEKINAATAPRTYDLAKQVEKISERYDETLHKLAQ